MQAYHNNPNLKQAIVAQMAEHRRLEQLIQGEGWYGGKGCMIGCVLHEYDHSRLPDAIGVPEDLGRLVDAIFEGLPKNDAEQFSDDFWEAIAVGSDLSPVPAKFSLWLLMESGVRDRAFDDGKDAIDTVINLLQRQSAGDLPTESEWSAAESAAESAMWAAAESAMWAAAGSAARSARSAAWSAARAAAWKDYAAKLIKIVKEIK